MATRLKLLAEQLKISILERNRLIDLRITPSQDDEEEMQHSLNTLYQGIQSLDGNGTEYRSDALQDDISLLKRGYRDLRLLYDNEEPVFDGQTVGISHTGTSTLTGDQNDSAALMTPERSRKSVRFTDTLIDSGLSDGDLLQMQTQVMREQDSSLDALSQSIGRQRELSIQIGDELDEHGELLDNVTSMVDHSSQRLDQAKTRLTKFSRKARENSHLMTIVLLIIVLVLLLALL